MPKVILDDHYSVLGVSYDADESTLKKQYRKLARETHPDSLGPEASETDRNEANELFTKLSIAYEQLNDPQTRKTIDKWLSEFEVASDPTPTVIVPEAGQHLLGGVYCWVEFRRLYVLRATVSLQLADLFKVTDLSELPHNAWLDEVIAVDEKGDVVGRSYSLMGLRHSIRLLRAEARRNHDRRIWRTQLEEFKRQINTLARSKPVDHLRQLLLEAHTYVESGAGSLWRAEARDTVVRAIRELEKEIERAKSLDSADILLEGLLSGQIQHPDLNWNAKLLEKLRIYELRAGGQYMAPTDEQVSDHYRTQIKGLSSHTGVLSANLRLPDDEPVILELAAEGALELAPDTVEVPGNKGLKAYDVRYGYTKQHVPAGIITVPESTFEKNSAQYGRVSRFPVLPHDIVLLIRVRVNVQGKTVISDPAPDGKALLNEVQRCRKRLRNPKELAAEDTTFFLATF